MRVNLSETNKNIEKRISCSMQCSSLHEKIEVKSTDGDYISASEI